MEGRPSGGCCLLHTGLKTMVGHTGQQMAEALGLTPGCTPTGQRSVSEEHSHENSGYVLHPVNILMAFISGCHENK